MLFYVCEPWEGLAGTIEVAEATLATPDGQRSRARAWVQLDDDGGFVEGAGVSDAAMPSDARFVDEGTGAPVARTMTTMSNHFWFA